MNSFIGQRTCLHFQSEMVCNKSDHSVVRNENCIILLPSVLLNSLGLICHEFWTVRRSKMYAASTK